MATKKKTPEPAGHVSEAGTIAELHALLAKELAEFRFTLAEGFTRLVAAWEQRTTYSGSSSPALLVTDFPMKKDELPPAPPAEATPEFELDDVRAALNDYTRVRGLSEASKVVSSLGVKRLTELPPERYGEAIEALR